MNQTKGVLVKYQKTILTLVLLPILVGCDGFNIGNGMTKVTEARECYEALKAKADTTKLRSEYPDGNINKNNYELASTAATNWLNLACKDVRF